MGDLKNIAARIMRINHISIQCDDIHACEFKHQIIIDIDKLDRFEAVRLLMHVIHVQQLALAGATVELYKENPFSDMGNFDYIDSYVKHNSPNLDTLY